MARMTREENIRAILECNFSGTKEELIDIAVKNIMALEQDPCDDCIFKNEWNKIGKLLSNILEKHSQKSGKWINGVCDNCKYDWGKDAPIASVPNYCPSCGACMREGRTLDEFIEDSKESEEI